MEVYCHTGEGRYPVEWFYLMDFGFRRNGGLEVKNRKNQENVSAVVTGKSF